MWIDNAKIKTAEDKYTEASESSREQAKFERNTDLSEITYDFGDGRIIQVRPQDLQNMQLAIEMGITHNWVMADNTVKQVTSAELQEAYVDGITQGQEIWSTYINKVKEL